MVHDLHEQNLTFININVWKAAGFRKWLIRVNLESDTYRRIGRKYFFDIPFP